MALFAVHHPLVFTFGVLGNLVSILVYFAPLPTFVDIYRKKSTLGYQSLPYVVALFSAMLWMYYAFLKPDSSLLISINSFGCVIETIYIGLFLAYASKDARNHTVKLIAALNMGFFSLILLLTLFLVQGGTRTQVVGWICVGISVAVFAAPLSIVLQVVRTRSVEYMPFSLSFFLTLSATMWFTYGLLQRDKCIAIPNVFGFFLGLLQMMLYGKYRNTKKLAEEKKLPEQIINIVILGASEVHPEVPAPETDNEKATAQTMSADEDEKEEKEQTDIHDKSAAAPTPIAEPSHAIVQLEQPVLVMCAA
ncbi:bidirectional sugar transporter N3-like [Diospyros lotus]|uniref:bidirectional sugar transporter N3-like n=1 Tax=Diospyros lotus TaxID=55363 RepID=UPI0022556DB6|nr:bidirectional sugar transporter N3-like [Diospyros lotus]XP_052205541.1 bidirectional sugar transporter N3-like [Diospyros lotus]